MATAATIKKNIAKLEAALKSKATPKTLKPKLEAQLVKSKAELSGINKGTKPKTSSTKSTQTALQKLKEMVNKNKKYKTYKGAGVDLEKDADRPALRTGKRIAKESGKTYYEYRANRIDVKQPPKKYPKLEKGGYMARGGNVEGKSGSTYKIEMWKSFDDMMSKQKPFKIVYSEREDDLRELGEDNRSSKLYMKRKGKYMNITTFLEKGGYMAKGGVVGEYKVVPNKRGEGKLRMYVTSDYEMAFTISGSKEEAEKAAQNFVKEHNETHPTATVTKIHPSGQPIKNKNVSYVTKDEIAKFEDGGYMAKGGKTKDDAYYENWKAPKEIYSGKDIKVTVPKMGDFEEYKVIFVYDKENFIFKMYDPTKKRVLVRMSGLDFENNLMNGSYIIDGYMADGGLVVKSDEDLREIAKYMAKAVKKNADLKDLVYYFEQENNYDYKYRVKIWDEMNVWEMKKTEENIYKVLKAIVEANEGGKMEKGGYYAKGGLTEHGLKVGDTIVDDMFWDKSVKVLNSKTGYAVVKIETGERKEMKAMGGEMHRTQE